MSFKESAKSVFDKFIAAIKSAPAVFAYGVAVGAILGGIFF